MWSFFSRDPSKDFPYEIGEAVPVFEDETLWSLHKGKKKSNGDEVSVFVFDVRTGSETQLEICKAAIKRLKTLRHPSILTYLESFESDKVLYLATEYVEPLKTHISGLSKDASKELYLAWGIFQITRGLSFLNNDGNLRHGNVCLSSIFVNAAGEWKLGGLEYVTSATASDFPIKILPTLEKYDPPEKNDPKNNRTTKCSTDMWGLGCLIWEVFNGPLPRPSSLRTLENIPKSLVKVYYELVATNPSARPNPADVITNCRKAGGFFKNDLVDTLLFLEEIQIKDKGEKNRFFSALAGPLDLFPEHVCRNKILPQLITAFEYGEAGSAVLTPMFKLGRLLNEEQYQKMIVPCVVKLFGSNERATRVRLLMQLEHFIGHLHSNTVNDQIFPLIVYGFMDTNSTVREQTVKSVIHLAPKLNYANLNLEVLRHFARLQSKDEVGGIRTNTTVCLGKIAQHLHPQIRQKVLISAFVRATRDPFPPARSAGILALAATQQYYRLSDVSSRILPALCHLTLDPEKSVRESAFRTIKGFLGKLEKVSEDPNLKEAMEADVNTATPSLSNAAATWAGWAVTAVTAKFYRSQSDTARSAGSVGEKSSSGSGSGTATAKTTLSKPASLEQPSSSSISTTTSSVTSMTSLEHEGGDSVSDYEEGWDADNWGDMETQNAGPETKVSSTGFKDKTEHQGSSSDGWDTGEWGLLEEEDENKKPAADGWAPSTEVPTFIKAIGQIESGDSANKLGVKSHHISRSPSGLDEPEWEPFEEAPGYSLANDETRKRRDEKKIARQRELEARRAQRAASGPMKLGTKKS